MTSNSHRQIRCLRDAAVLFSAHDAVRFVVRYQGLPTAARIDRTVCRLSLRKAARVAHGGINDEWKRVLAIHSKSKAWKD